MGLTLRSAFGLSLVLTLAALNPWTFLNLMACSALLPSEEAPQAEMPPECSEDALAGLAAGYAAEVLSACQGKEFDRCPEREPIEAHYRARREDWARCQPQR